ncbi:MAG: methyl-accepting chemotaxis protein, partial [Duganella sp.]
MLKKLRIGPKLLLAPGLVLVLLIVTAAAGYHGMVRQNASMENLVQVRAERLKAAADVSGEARYAHAHIYQLLAWTNGSFAQARLDALGKQIKARHASIEAQLRRLAADAGDDAAERKIVERSLLSLAAYRKAVLETMDMAQMDQSIATNSMAKAEKQFLLLNEELEQLSTLQKQLSVAAHARAKGDFAAMTTTMGVVVLLSIALSLGVTMAVRGAMLRDIRGIADVVVALAAGKLGAGRRNDGRDEIADTARMLDQTMGNLTQTLGTILTAVRSIDTAAHEIASGNLDLSTRTEMQASSLEQTASAMDGLTHAVRQNAANAQQACRLAAGASEMAQRGGDAVQQAVRTMTSIRASSRQIVDIISVIDGISFQTNILALNAAVEAARAGEQGRSFAVVASEVRTLAQRSAAAAKEIKQLIGDSVSQVDSGARLVDEAG